MLSHSRATLKAIEDSLGTGALVSVYASCISTIAQEKTAASHTAVKYPLGEANTPRKTLRKRTFPMRAAQNPAHAAHRLSFPTLIWQS